MITERHRAGLAYETSREQTGSPGTREAFEAYRHQPPLRAFRWQPGHGAQRLSSVVPRRELRRLEFHQEYLAPIRRRPRAGAAELTRRAAQVLTVAMWGRTNREIGDLLVISPATVRKHLEHANAKLGVRNRAEAFAQLLGIGPRH